MRERYEELDSLRGLAALIVVFYHLGFVLPGFDRVENHPFLHLFLSGHESVLFFFVLSGFVLSIPFYGGRQTSYRIFVIRRFLRIYVPYICSVAIAIVCCLLFSQGEIQELSYYFNLFWTEPFSWNLILNHVLLLGNFNTDAYNPVIWSLVHEMRISIIFPFIMPLVIKLRTPVVLAGGLALTVAELAMNHLLNLYNLGFFYLFLFIVGALLVKHKQWLMARMTRMMPLRKLGFLLVALLFYNYSAWFLPDVSLLHRGIIQDLFIAIGVSMLILLSLSSKGASFFLRLKPVHFLGKISYSFYLYHVIVILLLMHLLYGVVPTWAILSASFVLSIIVSAIAYYSIERFSIEAGRKLKRPKEERVAQSLEWAGNN